MAGYKEPGFETRVAAAAQSKVKALARLKSAPPPDPVLQAERAAKALERETARTEKRQAAEAEKLRLQAEERDRKAELEKAATRTRSKPELTPDERKAARDARFAARKARKGRKN